MSKSKLEFKDLNLSSEYEVHSSGRWSKMKLEKLTKWIEPGDNETVRFSCQFSDGTRAVSIVDRNFFNVRLTVVPETYADRTTVANLEREIAIYKQTVENLLKSAEEHRLVIASIRNILGVA